MYVVVFLCNNTVNRLQLLIKASEMSGDEAINILADIGVLSR